MKNDCLFVLIIFIFPIHQNLRQHATILLTRNWKKRQKAPITKASIVTYHYLPSPSHHQHTWLMMDIAKLLRNIPLLTSFLLLIHNHLMHCHIISSSPTDFIWKSRFFLFASSPHPRDARYSTRKRSSVSTIRMGCLSLSAIKRWSFGVKFHHKKRIHSSFLVNQKMLQRMWVFQIWLMSLWHQVICQNARQDTMVKKNCYAVMLSSNGTRCSLVVCLVEFMAIIAIG